MKKILLFFLLFPVVCWGQYTQIPDGVFEQYLINLGIDTEGIHDGQVLTDDIDHITSLQMSPVFPEVDPLIQDLTGIEDFVSLESLRFGSNAVVNVDLSQNTQLKTLVCKFNALESLDVSNNLLLEAIDAANCLPGLCPNTNTFTSIDLSANVNLESVFIPRSHLTTIDLSNNPNIDQIFLLDSQDLQSIIVDNGNNLAIEIFRVTNVPSLVCIQVDDPAAATAGDTFPYDQWEIDDGVIFSDDCSLGTNEYLLKNSLVSPNPTNGSIEISLPSGVQLKGWSILDLQGRELLSGEAETASLTKLPSGIYLLVVETNVGSLAKKVMRY
ncbi:MAG: T9SS type A sorting domain-containing protein [Flavobacteriaceae bacterium]|nr:T9SS type A sorting domain-containing protein [Flavobacteriaceae bacterium]